MQNVQALGISQRMMEEKKTENNASYGLMH